MRQGKNLQGYFWLHKSYHQIRKLPENCIKWRFNLRQPLDGEVTWSIWLDYWSSVLKSLLAKQTWNEISKTHWIINNYVTWKTLYSFLLWNPTHLCMEKTCTTSKMTLTQWWWFKKTTKCCDSKLQDQIEVINDIKSKGKQSPRNAAAIVRIRIQGQTQDSSLEEWYRHVVFDTTCII